MSTINDKPSAKRFIIAGALCALVFTQMALALMQNIFAPEAPSVLNDVLLFLNRPELINYFNDHPLEKKPLGAIIADYLPLMALVVFTGINLINKKKIGLYSFRLLLVLIIVDLIPAFVSIVNSFFLFIFVAPQVLSFVLNFFISLLLVFSLMYMLFRSFSDAKSTAVIQYYDRSSYWFEQWPFVLLALTAILSYKLLIYFINLPFDYGFANYRPFINAVLSSSGVDPQEIFGPLQLFSRIDFGFRLALLINLILFIRIQKAWITYSLVILLNLSFTSLFFLLTPLNKLAMLLVSNKINPGKMPQAQTISFSYFLFFIMVTAVLSGILLNKNRDKLNKWFNKNN